MSASSDAGFSVLAVVGGIFALCILKQCAAWCLPAKWCPCLKSECPLAVGSPPRPVTVAAPPLHRAVSKKRRGHSRLQRSEDDDGSGSEEGAEEHAPSPGEVALQETARREAALARRITALESALQQEKQQLLQHQVLRQVLTARLEGSAATARGPPPLTQRDIEV